MNECPFCGEEVNINKPGYFREEIGWGEVRHSGGTNSLKNKSYTGRVAHRYCLKYGGGDLKLFDEAKQERFDLEATKAERFG